MNIPNILTLIRFALIPVFIYTFYNSTNYIIPVLVFILAGFTDVLDGYIARKFNLITKWGTILDPLADKLLQISVLFVLTDKKLIPLWIIIVVSIKELFMVIGGSIIYKNKISIESKWYGKTATVLFYIAIVTVMFVGGMVGRCIITLAVIFTLYSAVQYAIEYIKNARVFNKLKI